MVAVPEQFAGDFEQAYRTHYPMLYRRSRRWLPPGEAEDAVQETFLRAWARHGSDDPGAAWLLTVLRNLAIDRSRKRMAHPVPDLTPYERPQTASSLDDDVIRLDERRAVRNAIANLTDGQREVLRLREWEGMSHQEIADALGTTIPSVESLLVRGRKRLRRMLDQAMGLVAWPLTFAWRRPRGGHELPAIAAPATQSAAGWSAAVANVATAGIILLAGAGPAMNAATPDLGGGGQRERGVTALAPGIVSDDSGAWLAASSDAPADAQDSWGSTARRGGASPSGSSWTGGGSQVVGGGTGATGTSGGTGNAGAPLPASDDGGVADAGEHGTTPPASQVEPAADDDSGSGTTGATGPSSTEGTGATGPATQVPAPGPAPEQPSDCGIVGAAGCGVVLPSAGTPVPGQG